MTRARKLLSDTSMVSPTDVFTKPDILRIILQWQLLPVNFRAMPCVHTCMVHLDRSSCLRWYPLENLEFCSTGLHIVDLDCSSGCTYDLSHTRQIIRQIIPTQWSRYFRADMFAYGVHDLQLIMLPGESPLIRMHDRLLVARVSPC